MTSVGGGAKGEGNGEDVHGETLGLNNINNINQGEGRCRSSLSGGFIVEGQI